MTSLSEFHEAGNYTEGPVYDAYEHAKYKEEENREKTLGSAVDHLRHILQKLDRVFLIEQNKKLEGQLNKQKQNQCLKEARDILLPRLMTGKITVE